MRSNNRRGRCHVVKRKHSAGAGKGSKRGGYVSRLPKQKKKEQKK